jgi:CBS domain-containing protein
MKVHEFMKIKIEYIEGSRSVYDAIEKMVDRRIRSLVVRFTQDEARHGVVTARDIVFKVLAKGINPNDIKVSQVASKPLVCIDKDMDLDDAATLMGKSGIARVFVCEEDKIIGVVSLMDFMTASLIMRARGEHVS